MPEPQGRVAMRRALDIATEPLSQAAAANAAAIADIARRIDTPRSPAPPPIPVRGIFMASIATNPAVLLGYGTWNALGNGAIPVGGGAFIAYAWERTA